MSTMRVDKIINRYISSQMRLRQRTANQKAIETNTISQDAAIEDDLLTLYGVHDVNSRMSAGGNDDDSDDNYEYDECVKEQQKKREVRHCCEPCQYGNICWTRDRYPHQSLSNERVIVLRNGDACPDYELSRCDPRINRNPMPDALLIAIQKRKAKELEFAQKLDERRRLAHERQEKAKTEMLKPRLQIEVPNPKESKLKQPKPKPKQPKPKPELQKGKEQPKKQKPTKPNTDRKKRKKAALNRLPAGGECQLCGREIGSDQNGVCTPCGKKIRNIVSNYVNNEKTRDDDSQYDVQSVPSGKSGATSQLNDEPSFSVVVLKEQDNNSLVERITEAINRSATTLDVTTSKANIGWQAPKVEPFQRRTCPSGCNADKRFEFSQPNKASPEFNGGNMRNMNMNNNNRNPVPSGGGGCVGGSCGLMDDDRYCIDDCTQMENRYPGNDMRPCPMMNDIINNNNVPYTNNNNNVPYTNNNNNIPYTNNNFSNNMVPCPENSMLNEMHVNEYHGAIVSPSSMPENQLSGCSGCARCQLQNNPIITDLLVKALQIFIEKFEKPKRMGNSSGPTRPSSSHFNRIKSDTSIQSRRQPIKSQPANVRKPPLCKPPISKPTFSKPPQGTTSNNRVQESPSAKRNECVPTPVKEHKPLNKRDKKKDKKGKKAKADKCEGVITCPCCKVKIRNNLGDCEVLASPASSNQQIQQCPNRKPNSNIDMRTMNPRHAGCFSGCPGHRRTDNSQPKPQIKGCGCPIASTRYVGGGSATETAKHKILSPISHYRPGTLHRRLSYILAAGNANRRSLVKTAAGTTTYEKKFDVRIRNELDTAKAKGGKNQHPLSNAKGKNKS